MLFDESIDRVKSALLLPLPGEAAQHLLAPVFRKTTRELLKERPSHRMSSVMMLLYPDSNGVTHTVFIERPISSSVHSGQIAFPGGKVEEHDLNLEQTALRETEEEIGVAGDKIQVLGTLSPLFIPASNFLVQPYIGVCESEPEFIANPDEVKSIIPFSIPELLKMDSVIKTFITPYGNLQAPCFEIYSHDLWGATAMMVSEFREMIGK